MWFCYLSRVFVFSISQVLVSSAPLKPYGFDEGCKHTYIVRMGYMGTWGHDKVLLAGWLHIQTHTMHIGMRTPTQALCSILWPRAACMHADIYRGPVQHARMRTPSEAPCSMYACGHLPRPRAARMHADTYRGPVQHVCMRTPTETPCSTYACGHLPRPRAARMHADTYRGPVQHVCMRTPTEAPCSTYACGHLPRPHAARMHADTYRGPVQHVCMRTPTEAPCSSPVSRGPDRQMTHSRSSMAAAVGGGGGARRGGAEGASSMSGVISGSSNGLRLHEAPHGAPQRGLLGEPAAAGGAA